MSDPTLYTIGWICAISTEQTAARQFLDEHHDQPAYVSQHDNNAYTLGRTGKHNVVVAALPDGEYGECSAAAVARDMLSSFPNVRIGLMVGIGGGAPSPKHDIRLGDVVVSSPVGGDGGVFQYDFGKTIQNQEFQHTKHLDQPPTILRTTVASIKSQHEEAGNQIEAAITAILDQKPRLTKSYKRPDASTDQLYKSSCVHRSQDGSCREHCGSEPSNIVSRPVRGDDDDNPAIHYGLIASANQVMKDATIRDTLIKEKDVLCFEMEAAGLMNHFPCLVIRGVCDYSDSHKNKQWQGYAAMAAAAYAKQVLENIAPTRVENERKVADVLKNIEGQVAQVASLVSEMNITAGSIAKDAKLQRMRDWLAPHDPSSNHNNAVAQCHKGTGQWLIQGETFIRFKYGTLPFLWLNGIPGCGKTVLSSSIIEDLNQDTSSPFCRILYFYFDFNDARKQTFDSILRSLLWQAVSYPGSSSKALGQLYDSCQEGSDQAPITSLVRSLNTALRLQATAIVIDALDECTTRLDVLSWLASLMSNNTSIVRVIVTSRKDQDIEAEFNKWLSEDATVAIQEQDVDADISAYISHRLRIDPQLQRWHGRENIQDEIRSNLMAGARGMFRWVKCQLDTLTECLSYPQLIDALRSLPQTLNATYARMIEQISKRHREQAIRLLQVLIWSDVPLTIDQAVDLLAVDPEREPGFDVQNRMPVPKEITRLCPGLVTITQEIVDFTTFGSTQPRTRTSLVVHLSHFSVKEYLTSQDMGTDFHPLLGRTTAAERIASISLAYILAPKQPICNLNADFPLFEFCVRGWMNFARLANEESKMLQRLTIQLFSQPQHFKEWSTAFEEVMGRMECRAMTPPAEPLYYASLGGLQSATQALLETGADVNARGGSFDNALQAAVVNSHKEVVSMLLDNGADVDSRGSLARRNGFETNVTALYSAVIDENYEMVELLLQRGANTNIQCGKLGNALQVACNQASEPMARMLLDHGAEINARSPQSSSALQAACAAGHWELTDLLLRRGADMNHHGDECSNAMVAACSNGHLDIATMLIKRGADINACGGFYGNALQTAAYLGYEEVVQWLLDNDADVNAKGGCLHRRRVKGWHAFTTELRGKIKYEEERTSPALHLAAGKGHRHVVSMLLNSGADRTMVNSHGAIPLRVAFENGHANVMSLLLETGTNNHEELESEPLMLHLAVQRGQEDLVQLLLDHGAKVDAVDGQDRTALYHAIDHGHQVIAVILIRHDPNCGAQKIRGRSIVDFATEKGQIYILQLLFGERRC